ncbi:type II toxin-antitoxin system PemK/MazF family toxin [Frankia sp. AiPa1]|nr:type II toxin-antitoxin system PemK/MazF family toxin [Frankia sp. AiPa1]
MVDFGEPVGHEQGLRRPAVVVSADRLNRSRAGLSIVVPLTRTHRGLPSHVELEPGGTGLRETSYAKVEDVKSVSQRRLTRRLGVVDPDHLLRMVEALRFLLDI